MTKMMPIRSIGGQAITAALPGKARFVTKPGEPMK
jgi:hypothetical protein